MEYQVTVDQFTGPLDLLLHLIKEHDMDLLDLDVAAVCDQYLAYIQTMDPSLLEAVSEYLVMAAWLIEMKSKLLLPKPEIDEEDDYEAERKRMIERLIEKNRINGILEAFEASYDKRQTMHSKIPSALEEYLPSGEETIPEGMEVYDLIKAMQRVMQRRALLQPLESKIARVEISIDERTEQIRNYFLRHKDKTVDFEDLFDEGDRYFAIVTFLSILVLVKNSELLITQSGNFEKEQAMDKNEYLSVIEGMLYIYGDEGVTIKDVAEALEITKKEAYELMDELLSYYASKTIKGIDICDFGGTYKMVTLPQHDVYYKKMMATSGRKLSKSALETLAIVAYYQPVTRIRIEEIRGVGCESMIRKLLAQALIKEVGRDDSPGKPVLYGVTDEFMDAFNLKSLDELPELKEIESEFDEEDIFNTKYQEKVEEKPETN